MTSARKTAELVERHIGINSARTMQVFRKLREAGLLPSGAPGVSPELNRDDVFTLLVAVATGAKLDNVAEFTRATLATTPGGADVCGAPLTMPRTAEIGLAVLANMAAAGDELDGVTVEIVHGWPEVALAWDDGKIQRFQQAGSITNHQPSHKGRVATTIPGPAFSKLIKEAING